MELFKNKQGKNIPYSRYYIGLSQFLSPTESRIILHLSDQEYQKGYGFVPKFTMEEYAEQMGLDIKSFETSIEELEYLDLIIISRNEDDKYISISLDTNVLERLVVIFSRTKNINFLKAFNEKFFIKEGRSILSIKDEEIEMLGNSFKMNEIIISLT